MGVLGTWCGEEMRRQSMCGAAVQWLVDLRVEICDDCALALGDGDVLIARALDDGERYVFLRHYKMVSICSPVDAKLNRVVSLLTGW